MPLVRVVHQPLRCLALVTRRCASSAATATGADATSAKKLPSESTPLSSCIEGTKLEGVNFLKGQAPVVALSDNQYPAWLWTLLQPKVYADEGPGSKAERVKRRADSKQKIKDRNFMSTQ